LTAGETAKEKFFMWKKTMLTGMLTIIFALTAIGGLAAQENTVRPPRGFVGMWHLVDFPFVYFYEIRADGTIWISAKIIDENGSIISDSSSLLKISLGVIRVVSPTKIIVGDIGAGISGDPSTFELVGQWLVNTSTPGRSKTYIKGEPKLR
jgi:hypothetical protein